MSASIKEHKWVNNHGQPPSKRRRINAACLTCRKRKTRCAGEKPVCSTCSKNGHRCLGYNEVEDKRNVSLKAEPENNCGGLSHADIKQERQEPFVFYSAKGARDDNKVDVWKNESFRQPMAGFVDAGSLSRQDSVSSATVASSAFSLRRKRSDELNGGDHSSGSSYTEDGKSTANQSSAAQQHQDEQDSLRVPYFRYFGPTAIVPGHKQMLVDLAELSQSRERRKSRGGSFSSTSPVSIRARYESVLMEKHEKQVQQQQSQLDGELHTLAEVHPYDMDDDEPPHKLVVLLVSTFFKNLGSNFRFLKEKRTMRLLQEKRLEPILVDAMCALAARFLDLPVFSNEHDGKKKRSEYGYVFAQRAKAATVDTFPCPSVAAVQACLLMAYEGFGANQDSSLWMYLGLAIRMAVDLGLQKTEGVKFRGEQDPWYTRSWSRDGQEEADHQGESEEKDEKDDSSSLERRAIEQERIDTFWAVFVLDRVISSGTGRPVTFRDTDFDLDFPQRRELPGPSGLPDPFPAFVEVIHLYGRVSDILNNIKCGADLDEDNFATLRLMEVELTALQQKHPGLLYFNPVHFQAYSAMGLGATFLLLHFWFHALVIILHQPTMLNEKWNVNPPTLLKPNSRELSLSSAKSIADILTVSELINFPSFIGNPFTSQPIYIAACAFLVETGALKSHPPSRAQSPHLGVSSRSLPWLPGTTDDIQVARNSLLASAASENYKNCYHALVALQYYWGGVEYIITALDQKSKGIWDCETFNVDEYEAIKQARRAGPLSRFLPLEFPTSPGPGLRPFACSLTGTTNSPNPAVTTLLYPKGAPAITQLHQIQPLSSVPISNATPPGHMPYDPIRQSLPDTPSASSAMFVSPYPQAVMSAVRHQPHAAKLPSSFRSTTKSMLKYESLSSGDADHNGISHSPSANNHPSYGSESSQDESPLSGKLLTSDEINSSGSSGSSNELDNIVQQENQDRSDVNIYSNDYDHDFSQGLLEMNHNMQFGGGGYNPLYMGETFAVNTQEVDFDSLGFPGNLGHWGVDPEAFISNMSSLFEGGVLTMQPNFHYM